MATARPQINSMATAPESSGKVSSEITVEDTGEDSGEVVAEPGSDPALRGMADCVAQLLMLQPGAALREELGQLLQRARNAGAQDYVHTLLPAYAVLQRRVLARDSNGDSNGDSAEDSTVVNADDSAADAVSDMAATQFASDGSLAGLPVYSSVAANIENTLAEMLQKIRPPESAKPALEQARKILGDGLNWYELAALLEQIEQVVVASADADHRELELEEFLQGLNSRLVGVGGGVQQINSMARDLLAGGATLDSDIRAGITGITDDLDSAASLEPLKRSVQRGVDKIISQLDAFDAEFGGVQSNYEEQINQLGQRIEVLETEAAQASTELQLQRQRNQLDTLTELANRGAYEHRLDVELERFDRYQQDFCLIIADIDHFKVINDNYGHLAGDKVLRLVAKTLHKRLRRVDFIARYGGEEFAIILPATDIDNALQLMQALGSQIRECPFHFDSQRLQITVSFGIARARAGDTAEQLFVRADRALYSAKQQGRDRSVVNDA